jgi:hypothetical protein
MDGEEPMTNLPTTKKPPLTIAAASRSVFLPTDDEVFSDLVDEFDKFEALRSRLERQLFDCKSHLDDRINATHLPSRLEIEHAVEVINAGVRDAMQQLRAVRDPFNLLKRSDILLRLGVAFKRIPQFNPSSPEEYTENLARSVRREKPTAAVLESTCAEVEATATFAPSVREIVPILRAQKKRWERRLRLWTQVCDGEVSKMGQELIAAVEEIQRAEERREQARNLFLQDRAALATEVLQVLRDNGVMSRRQIQDIFKNSPYTKNISYMVAYALCLLEQQGTAVCVSRESTVELGDDLTWKLRDRPTPELWAPTSYDEERN